jgi:group II intron reverse transcriptase/maturase
MVTKKREQMNEATPEKSASTPRTREPSPPLLLGSQQDISVQRKEDVGVRGEVSDPPIVVRDGRADHTAKGRAGGQRGQSTHAGDTNGLRQSVSSTLSALARKAAREKKHRFGSLYRLIDLQMLYESFRGLKRKAAPGVDGMSVADYEKNLEENLRSLHRRLIEKRYRAQNVKRRYIPKAGSKKLRPLGIPSLEDKIVQHAASRILESIYEEDFSDRSIGYRKGKPGARESSYQLTGDLYEGTCRWIVEADIRSFFDEVDHDWLVRMLEQRVDDRAFIGLIRKWLKAGVLEPGEEDPMQPDKGTPQGGIISPILANIYLHYVLDLWIERVVRKECRGKVIFMRYADDIIVGFEYQREAEDYLGKLKGRLAKFSLRLAEEKSALVKFNRWEPDDSGKFTFLGYEFYWARTLKNPNHKMVRRRTCKKKFRGALAEMKKWIKEARNWPLCMILSSLRLKLRGYWNYYSVLGNSTMTWRYYAAVMRLVFKWLNRRSQRRSFTWAQFSKLWTNAWQIPAPRCVEQGEPRAHQPSLALAP